MSQLNPLKSLMCETKENGISERQIMNGSDFCNKATTTITTITNSNGEQQSSEAISIMTTATEKQIGLLDVLIKPTKLSVGRERRNVSPSSTTLQDGYAEPHSPSSSSTTSQATSANDVTFEPTIEMMVNDFDDEQTLNEEEALAALESQDPDEEINTLKEESEMPLEELLAKYRAMPRTPPTFSELSRKKPKKSSMHKKKHKPKEKQEVHLIQTSNVNRDECIDIKHVPESTAKHAKANLEFIVTENGNDKKEYQDDEKCINCDEDALKSIVSPGDELSSLVDEEIKENDDIMDDSGIIHGEILKLRRSHLLDLYPEGTFDNVVVVNDAIAGNGKDIPLETLYGVEDDDEDEEIEEEEDEDYKKKVMIGSSYQAIIPVGLSQYGDVLPYENEDKLIWEPSQVSEREVEEYLIKIRDIKSNQQCEEEDANIDANEENHVKENGRSESNTEDIENNSLLANGDKLHVQTLTMSDMDSQSVVKDNEQALHLLVQCGYDFKEALRRKRLNALPLNDCMSLWSEEECHKFEEGIQKYGKDFLKIRQNQVRTRTMRELVQFYYLWKKSERRDHNFANADTVDHMDIYLNEDNEYGSNPASVLTPVGSPVGSTSTSASTRRNSNSSQKNISIMATTAANNILSPTSTNSSLEKNCSNISLQHPTPQKKRLNNSNYSNLNVATSNSDNENSATILSNSTK